MVNSFTLYILIFFQLKELYFMSLKIIFFVSFYLLGGEWVLLLFLKLSN